MSFQSGLDESLTTTCLVLCAGDNTRWGGHRGVARKHLVRVEGEALLTRILKQAAVHRPDRIVIIVREADVPLYVPYCLPGNEIHPLKPRTGVTEAWKYLSSGGFWNRSGRTVSLLGDVWFSDQAMDRIFNHPGDNWLAFGRSGSSRLTGCPWGELFAHRFRDPREHYEKLLTLDRMYRDGSCRRAASGWAHYQLMEGRDPGVMSVGPRFVEINDFTEDFDFPHDLERWEDGRRRFRTEPSGH